MKDEGTHIHSAIDGLAEFGCCKESLFPFVLTNLNQKPSPECYTEAKNYRIKTGMQLTGDLNEMRASLAEGFPFVFALTLVQSFVEAETNGGHVPMPVDDEEPENKVLGSHAMVAAGYSDRSQCFIVQNSWGTDWVSFFYQAFDYILCIMFSEYKQYINFLIGR
jgi:C1A family cysteine protease